LRSAEAFLARKWARELDYRLIKELWTFAGPEFLAHSWIDRAAEVPASLHATTIWLGANPIDALRHDALLNLGSDPPPAFETFERVFEVLDFPALVTERPGAVDLVDPVGTIAVDSGVAMQGDTIFRISSMTKPITPRR